MTKRANTRLKLPDDFLGTVQAFLSIPVPPKKRKAKRAAKKAPQVRPKVTK